MKIRVLLISLLLLANFAYADVVKPATPQPILSLTTAQNIPFEICTKMFEGVNKEKLFYLTLGAINANNFSVSEVQTKNGYIIFSAAGNKYLANISEIDDKNSILRITPCNNIYHFPPGIIVNIFKHIDLNKNSELN